jgi:hypothetical protein
MEKKPTVSLRVYRGKKMFFDENGNPQNENQSVKLTYDTPEWKSYLKNLAINGYCKATVEAVKIYKWEKQENGELKETVVKLDDIDDIKKEVDNAWKVDTDAKLTPEQIKIAELEAKLEALLNGTKAVKKEVPTVVETVLKGEETLREKYERIIGKKPFAGWKDDVLELKINEFIANN